MALTRLILGMIWPSFGLSYRTITLIMVSPSLRWVGAGSLYSH